MLQSRTQLSSGYSTHSAVIPPGTFLFNPYHAGRIIGRSQLWHVFKKELLGFSFLLFLSIFLLLIAIQAVVPLLEINRIEQFGISAQASITGTHEVQSGGRNQLMYQLQYRFTDASGTLIDGKQAVNLQSFRHFQTGDSVPIRYLADDPSRSALTGWAQDNTMKMSYVPVGLTGLSGFIITLAALWFLGTYLWREEYLFRHGRLIMGHVLACHAHTRNLSNEMNTIQMGSRRVVTLSYSFCAPGGQVMKSTAERPRSELSDCSLPKFGDPVAVLYLDSRRYKVL